MSAPPTLVVTPEMRAHSLEVNLLYFAGAIFEMFVLLSFLGTGLSRSMRDLAARLGRGRFRTAFLFFAFFIVAQAVVSFPFDWWEGFALPHRYALSHQTFVSWLADRGKELAVVVAVGGAIVGGSLALIRRFRRRWPLVVWGLMIPFLVFLLLIEPVAIEPLFNKFEPLRDESLKTALLDEAGRAGISGGRVYQVNRSKQTDEMNAYVTGIGATKRIVLWDTILNKMNRDELLVVMGHEMGHYVLNHLWKGLAFSLAFALGLLTLARPVIDAGITRFGARWGFSEPSDPAAIPWLLLVFSIAGFLAAPAANAFSRGLEHQADVFGLELTGLPEAGASAFTKFAIDSKVDPDPPGIVKFWRYTHPTLHERIEFCKRWRVTPRAPNPR